MHRVVSRWVLNISREGHSAISQARACSTPEVKKKKKSLYSDRTSCVSVLPISLLFPGTTEKGQAHPLDTQPEDICIHILRDSEDVTMDPAIMTLALRETLYNGSWMAKPIQVASDHAWDKYIKLFFTERWHGTLCFSYSFSDKREISTLSFRKKRNCLQILDHLKCHRAIVNIAALVKGWAVGV